MRGDNLKAVQVDLLGKTVVLEIRCDNPQSARKLFQRLRRDVDDGHLTLELDRAPDPYKPRTTPPSARHP